MNLPRQRRGACPGPWTPMASGDGLLMRIRTGAGALRSDQLRILARLARAHGNGVIELTRRANLQLRGLRPETIAEVRDELIACGLADPSPLGEAKPVLLVDPLSGIEERCAVVDEVARAIDGALGDLAATFTLSPKLGVVIDGGSGAASAIDADIRVELDRDVPGIARLLVGAPEGACTVGTCRAEDAAPAVTALFVELVAFAPDRDGAPRMRDLVRARGITAVQASVAPFLITSASPKPRTAPVRTATLGLHPGVRPWFGFGVPFGSAMHDAWAEIAALAERFGDGAVRLTPSREVAIGPVRPELAGTLADAVRELGMITTDEDPRLRVVACAGAPACSSAHGETRALAVTLAARVQPLLARGATLHVSGCGKSCASRAVAAMTVVLAEGGARFGANLDVAAACAAPIEPIAALHHRLEAEAR